jgi:hypothetical protein
LFDYYECQGQKWNNSSVKRLREYLTIGVNKDIGLRERNSSMDEKGPNPALVIIILILGTLPNSGCTQGGSIPTHSPVAPTSTIETIPTLEELVATGLTPTLETTSTPEELTTTGLTPQENVDRYGIPREIMPFEYAVPDGMIKGSSEIQAMIDAVPRIPNKITNMLAMPTR